MDLIEFQKWEDEMEKNSEKRDEYKKIKNQWANHVFEFLMEEFGLDPKESYFKHMTIDIFKKYYKLKKNRHWQTMKCLCESNCIYEEDFEKYKNIVKWTEADFMTNPNVSYVFIKKYLLSKDFIVKGKLYKNKGEFWYDHSFKYVSELNKNITWENTCDLALCFFEKYRDEKLICSIKNDYICNKNLIADLFMKNIDNFETEKMETYIYRNPNAIYISEDDILKYKIEDEQKHKDEIIIHYAVSGEKREESYKCELYDRYCYRIPDLIAKEPIENIDILFERLYKIEKQKKFFISKSIIQNISLNPSFSLEFILSETYRKIIIERYNFMFLDIFHLKESDIKYDMSEIFMHNSGITLDELKYYKDRFVTSSNKEELYSKIGSYIEKNDLTRDRMNYFRKHTPHLFE